MRTLFDQRRADVAPGAVFWLVLAAVTLALAGALAFSLVVGRAPVISELIDDPRFFRRALVVHVVLSLWGWFFAYAVGLRSLVDPGGSVYRRRLTRLAAAIGVGALVASAGISGAQPLLVNYVPVVDHPLFLVGLALLFGAVSIELCRWPKARPSAARRVPAASAIAWRATAPLMACGILVFLITWWGMPEGLEGEVYFELLFWGVGHTLVVVSVLVMLGAWYYLLRDGRDRSPVGTGASLSISALLVAPWLIGPFLAFAGPTSGTYIRGFTRLMQFGIFVPVLMALVVCVIRCRRPGVQRAARWAFGTSAVLTVMGFVLGAMIRGSDTMIPAHYHASLGAITVALMALTYVFIHEQGWAPQSKWWKRLTAMQPVVFGVGQLVFSLGFALSGIFGVDRKAYGSDQVVDSAGGLIGLATMGIGGLLAVVGGAGFLMLLVLTVRHRLQSQRRMS